MNERIVVIDADEISGVLAQAALETAGHATWLVTDPAAAKGLVTQVAPHVVVLDVSGPDLPGLALLRELRQEAAMRSVPAILLSVESDSASRIRGLRSGAQDFLGKPFDPEELVLRVEGLLKTTSSLLTGALETHSLSDVLQNLRESGKSGRLFVDTPRGIGWIELRKGELQSVTYRHLTGEEAVLALLSESAGRFRLESGVVEPTGPTRDMLSLRTILLEYAWMVDELARRRANLPGFNVPLGLDRDANPDAEVDETLSELPFFDVVAALRAEPESTTRELRSVLPYSPLKLDLTLAVLAEIGVIVVAKEASSPRRETRSQVLEQLRKVPLRSPGKPK